MKSDYQNTGRNHQTDARGLAYLAGMDTKDWLLASTSTLFLLGLIAWAIFVS